MLLLTACLWPFPGVAQTEAVLALTNGRIWTGVESEPWVEAAVIRGNRVVTTGSAEEVMSGLSPEAEVFDLGGRMVTPGFIDTHTHFNRAGALLLGVNLLDVADDESLRTRVDEAQRRLPAEAWIVGGDWGAYALGSEWYPRRGLLDELAGDRPAFLTKWDRSQAVANTAALVAAGIALEEATEPLSQEQAERVRAAIPPPAFEQELAENRLALADLAAHGVTTIHDITGARQMRLFQYLLRRDSLSVRVCARPTLDQWPRMAALGIESGFGNPWLRLCGLKGFVDGIMGNSSAMFREPYRHTPDSRGRWRNMMAPPGNMERLIRGADSAGISPQIHAIGDLAVDTLLDMFETVITDHGPRDRRLRMIHAQVVEDDDFARFGELGVIAEVQPFHAIDDMRWMEERIGERSRGAYAFRSLQEGGALLIFGSDWPGTNASWYPADPILGIYAAVTRQTLSGEPDAGWYADERLTVQDALAAYTVNAAYASFEEESKGKLAPGYLADLVVLSENLFEIAPSRLKDVRVLRTMVDGRWVHTSPPPVP